LYGGIGLTIFLLVQSHQRSYGVIVILKVRPAMGWEQGVVADGPRLAIEVVGLFP
jgi:hypothetical protein